MFLEVVSILLITLPVVYPLITSLGFNGLWFGIVLVILMEFALITPPVGLNLFTIQGITRARLSEVVRGVLPFIALLAVGLALVVAYSPLSLRAEEHTSELKSLMRTSYAFFCLPKKKNTH